MSFFHKCADSVSKRKLNPKKLTREQKTYKGNKKFRGNITMKKINSLITNLVLISIFAAIGCISATAQYGVIDSSNLSEDTRPFDFSDKYYDLNGVQPYLIINRPTGNDGKSVFTKNADEEKFRDVRLIETLPAYNYDGSALYFNNYGELFDTSFGGGETGRRAMEVAESFPMFVFPSTTVRAANRQASLIDAREGYFTKNPLGLSLVVEVEFTSRADEEEGRIILKKIGETNGYSLDGTPIIKTVDEINYLTRMRIVTQTVKGLDTKGVPSYAIVKVMENTTAGAIAPDAFLVSVTGQDGQPLDSEKFFVETFGCLKESGNPCFDAIEAKR